MIGSDSNTKDAEDVFDGLKRRLLGLAQQQVGAGGGGVEMQSSRCCWDLFRLAFFASFSSCGNISSAFYIVHNQGSAPRAISRSAAYLLSKMISFKQNERFMLLLAVFISLLHLSCACAFFPSPFPRPQISDEFHLTMQDITVWAPRSSDVIFHGDSIPISWVCTPDDAACLSGQFSISIWQKSTIYPSKEIAVLGEGNSQGVFRWQIPTTIQPGDFFYVYVENNASRLSAAGSYFTIRHMGFHVTSPSYATTWVR